MKIMDEIEREKHYNCAPLNIERLRQSADKIRDNARQGLICAAWQAGIQRWAADTIEAQAEELAQKDARIARIEKALHLLIVHGEAGLTDEHDIEFANETLNEHPRQSVAEIEARTLERFRRALRGGTYMGDEWPGINFVEKWLQQEADRIRSEAKDSP